MSMFDDRAPEFFVPLGALRAHGCVLTEERTDVRPEPEDDRVRRLAEEQARESVREEVQRLRDAEKKRWETWDRKWTEALRELESDIQRQLIEMSLRVAEIILQREMPDADMLRSVLADVLAPISDLRGMRVRVAPDDMAMVQDGRVAPLRGGGIEWVPDAALKPGDMVVESRNGIFDGRLKERLAVLAEALENPARHDLPPEPAEAAP